MEPLLTSAESKKAEKLASSLGIDDLLLMEHAGMSLFQELRERFGKVLNDTQGIIVAGPGNNGADALVVARLFHLSGGKHLQVYQPEPSKSALGKKHAKILQKLGVKIQSNVSHLNADWILDGLLGVGIERQVEGKLLNWIERVNRSSAWVLSVDVPTGLNADTGHIMGGGIKAARTLSLGYLKRGLFTGEAQNYTGETRLATIQIPRNLSGISPHAFLVLPSDVRTMLPPRLPLSHKGHFGQVFIWAGKEEMQGASGMAALGAIRLGAGRTSVVGDSKTISSLRARLPMEVMTRPWPTEIPKDSVLVVGPGMGSTEADANTLLTLLDLEIPSVIDADAITVISSHKKCLDRLRSRKNLAILTPHPGEAARLLGVSAQEVGQDRFAAIEKLTKITRCTVVLKGRGTLLKTQDEPIRVVDRGHPNLAKGGSGDVLSGMLGALLSQKLGPLDAASVAVFLHGAASEWLTKTGVHETFPLASDLVSVLPDVWNEIAKN